MPPLVPARLVHARTGVLVTGASVLGLLLAAVVVAMLLHASSATRIDGLRTWDLEPSHTTAPVAYPMTPPVGGPHAAQWLNCGVYQEPVPAENAVHSLEHGAVWVTYRTDLPASDVAALVSSLPETFVILSPYEGLTAPVVASAWGAQVELDGPRDPRLTRFVRAYRQGPGTLEPGAPCHAGTDGRRPTPSPDPSS